MAAHYPLHIGSAGGGVTSTPNRGETWNVRGGAVPLECTVRALSAYPDDPHRILARSDAGLFRSENNGLTYKLLDTPMGDLQIWSLTVDPHNQDILYAGTCPEAFRSTNGGKLGKNEYSSRNSLSVRHPSDHEPHCRSSR